MFTYYLDLALRSLKRNKGLTVLMVLAIGLGIGASMTMITVLHVMTADPLPDKSARLFYPQIDPQDMEGYVAGKEPFDQFSWPDAMNLLHARKDSHQVAMTGGRVTVRPPQGKSRAFFADARYASADFFGMFDVPFLHGNGWSAEDDDRQARVAVISRSLADKLYGADHAVGQSLPLGKDVFRVIGVIDRWDPVPHFYDLTQGSYHHTEDVFLPLETAMALGQGTAGNMNCWGHADFPTPDRMKTADCAWMQFWVQLDTPAQVQAYREFLVHYSEQQKALGRFQRPPNTRLHDVMGWLDYNHVVPGSVQLQALLALGFMLVCLVNTVALLLVKFLRRSSELGVRRAMGASKRSVFAQLLVEASLVGLAGGVAGLLLAFFGLWIVRQQPAPYATYAHLDVAMLCATLVLALCATVLAAIFPAWRACRVQPARVLKIQ
ncbi:ABC transporter permease [Rhodanobacter sp. Col0626]|uniref:ABC transporter permease n=1 Tax=Rhodanobacter sp. Col0626 TaxID=3415679 RepID=UPI003CEB1D75